MVPTSLKEVLTNLEVSFAIVADLYSNEIRRIGEVENVDKTDLVTSLFADAETVQALDRSLEGQLLPQIWSQGVVSCIVCKPTDSTIVGLFVKDALDLVQQYHWSKKADQLIASVFEES